MEVVVIDDGSTDNTKDIVKKYQNKFSNLVYFYQENKGVGPARNYGIDISRGEYLIFMDPDDRYLVNDCIEKLYNAALENQVDICGGNILFNDNGAARNCYIAGDGDSNKSKNRIIKVCDYYYLYGHQRYLFNAKLIKEGNVIYAPYKNFEDQVFTINAMGLAGELYELDYPVYEYRINHKSYDIDLNVLIDTLKGFRDTLKLIIQYNLRVMLENNCSSFINTYIKKILEYTLDSNEELDGVIFEIDTLLEHTGWINDDQLISARINKYKKEKKEDIKIRTAIEQILHSGRKIVIYGAGGNARRLISLYHENLQNVIGIAVTNCKGNENDIEGIKVSNIEEYGAFADEITVMVTPGIKYKDEIIECLKKLKFNNYIWIDMTKLL
jgi:glycosyltransferase involved in cell wall biosynthesis